MSSDTPTVDPAVAAKHRAMWASGDYPKLARELVAPLGLELVEAAGIGEDDRVLDVAAGTGNASIPAAKRGARVVASDLTPELLQAGQALAVEEGVRLEWREADAQALPFGDEEFDAVISCIGVMFAPLHRPSAREMIRVCRPGGTIGVLSWTPEGFVGQLFSTMKPYMPPPPPGAQPPPLWGSEDHIRELFGEHVSDLVTERRKLAVDFFKTGDEIREYYKAYYGPTIAAYRNIAAEPDRVASLDADLAALGQRHLDASPTMHWEYLVVIARKR